MTTENPSPSDNGDQIWFVDHQQLDIHLSNPDGDANNKRPWLTLVRNRDGKIVGARLTIDPPTQEEIERLLGEAKLADDMQCATGSLPITLYTDNGAQFNGLGQPLLAMNIKVVRNAPGKPWGRGVVERTFKTLNTSLLGVHKGKTVPAITLEHLQSALATFIHAYNNRFGNTNTGSQE